MHLNKYENLNTPYVQNNINLYVLRIIGGFKFKFHSDKSNIRNVLQHYIENNVGKG